MRTVLIRLVHRRFQRGPGGHQQQQSDGEQRRDHDSAQRRERRTDHDTGDGRADCALKDRTHDAFDAVGGQQLFGRQNPRQDRAVGGKEERRGDAECGGGHRHVPDLQGANESQDRDG